MIDFTLKEMAFMLDTIDRVQLQGIEAKQLQLDIMRKLDVSLKATQKKMDVEPKKEEDTK